MPFLDQTHSVYFRHWQADDPIAIVVLLHGFGEHTGHYHRLAFELNRAGIDVWGLDHLGHGLSAGPRGRFESVEVLARHAQHLAALAGAYAPRLPLFLVGHSLGGVTAAVVATTGTPVAGVVLTGTPFDGLPDDVPPDAVMSQDPFYLDALETDPLGFDTAPAESALWDAIDDVAPVLRKQLPNLDVPVLLINGDQDVLAPPAVAQSAQALMRQADAVVLAGHHDIVNDLAHGQVALEIAQFVTRHSTSTPNVPLPTHKESS